MPHNFLHDLYDKINETPMQRKLREIAPMPIGAVFIHWPSMTEDDIRRHFRTMRELGFTNLKGIMAAPPMADERLSTLALEEGLTPWFYDTGGWELPTPQLCESLGIPNGLSMDDVLAHPKMKAHQVNLMRQRIANHAADARRGVHRNQGFLPAEADPNAVPGVVNSPEGTKLATESVPHFVKWLQQQYGTVDELKKAWNSGSSSVGMPTRTWTSWDDVTAGVLQVNHREFRHLRDILRFKSDVKLARLRARVQDNLTADSHAPMRAGGEISIFLPHVSWGIDMEGYAEIMAEGGAFYPSMHPGWHLEEVNFELLRPTYMQASMCVDWSKGIWSAPFESSGGPQWWSGGGKVPFVPEVREQQPAFTMTDGTLTQMIMTYMGAGFKGFGLWCWNPRDAGWEAGEYALCDRNHEVTPRAVQVGRIGKAMRQYRRELWNAHKEPWVGVLQDWENDAMWAALATPGRDRYKMEPIKARIGVARALINANVPWEHVTFRQLKKGLAPRYPAIYLPAVMCISDALMDIFTDYVQQGGRLVMDMPGAWLNEFGHLLPTQRGSKFERLFGCVLHEYGYTSNHTARIDGVAIEGFTATVTPTTARVAASYEGYPVATAITENPLGRGTAVLLGAAAALGCYRPGNTPLEALLVEYALGSTPKPFTCGGAIVYRLAGPGVDHYYLINEGPARRVELRIAAWTYTSCVDAVTGEEVQLGSSMELPPFSARWLRAVRAMPAQPVGTQSTAT